MVHIIQERFDAALRDKDDNIDFETLEATKEEVFGLLKQSLRPEFLNRIDEVVLFPTFKQIRNWKNCEFPIKRL